MGLGTWESLRNLVDCQGSKPLRPTHDRTAPDAYENSKSYHANIAKTSAAASMARISRRTVEINVQPFQRYNLQFHPYIRTNQDIYDQRIEGSHAH